MTNSDENKELLRDEEVTNKGAKSEDYAALLSKIRKQVDIEGESTLTRKYHEESNTDSVEINEESEKPQENDYEETVVLDRNELKQALIKQEVEEEILPEKNEDNRKPVLEVLGLKKRIGLKTIVEDISFDMHEGEIIGLLGPNGSGKTTIMRMLVGLTKTTKGEVYCFEKPLGLGKVKMLKEVGAMIETPEFYNYMSGWSNLKQMARVCGKKVSRARMKELVEFVGLSKVIRKKVKTYSLGMRQRLGLAQALLNDPKILILDEPVNGLDPQGVQDFRNKLKEIAATGVSILISSHLLDEIEKVSDRVIVIEKGRIIADDKLDNLVADETIKTLISTYDVEKAEILVRELGIRYELTKDGFIFENISREDKARVITYLVTNNVELDSIRELTTSLEDRFLQITGGENK
ncbi:ABC transporter ATP-binding protein [Gemella morbillorum]|uniref:ABC transporter ATP-binding protein n=1 Tax=Gemella morbillorum TaxID=29391 RepID=UPI0028D696FD|nr:ABC transporter ATP-binding protein [Gemella morbillorum]